MYRNYLKRGIDFILSLVGIIVLSPLFLILCLAIKLDSKGPIILNKNEWEKIKNILVFISSVRCE